MLCLTCEGCGNIVTFGAKITWSPCPTCGGSKNPAIPVRALKFDAWRNWDLKRARKAGNHARVAYLEKLPERKDHDL